MYSHSNRRRGECHRQHRSVAGGAGQAPAYALLLLLPNIFYLLSDSLEKNPEHQIWRVALRAALASRRCQGTLGGQPRRTSTNGPR